MISTHLNIFDAIVISIFALSCLFAFFRGFVREVLSLGAWIGAGLVTLYYFPRVEKLLEPHFKTPVAAAGVATIGLYVVALIAFSILNMIILKYVKKGSDVGMLDNFLGLIFGALRGALVVSLGFFLVSIAMPAKEYPDWLKQSVTRPYVEKGAVMLAQAAPNYLREISTLEKKAITQAKGRQESETDQQEESTEAKTTTPDDKEIGYSSDSNEQFNKLIDSTNTAK